MSDNRASEGTPSPATPEVNTDAEFLMNMAGHFWRMDRDCKSILAKGTSARQAARFERIAARLEALDNPQVAPATPAPSLREATERLLAMEAEVEKFREAFAPPAAVSERWYVAKEAFEEAANPAAILALYAELDFTKEQRDAYQQTAVNAVARRDQLGSALREARLIGTMMSNLCYNLAQQSGQPLSQPTCELMDEMRRKWAAAAGSTTP